MTQPSLQPQNETVYEQLISLIENSQQQLAPIIVGCDDRTLRQQIIQRYEAEARQARIQPYRIELGAEPSIRAALVRLKESDSYLQKNGEAVFTVTGAELLLRVHLRAEDTGQTQLDKFYGYLQWTREGLREFRYPIVLWVTDRILKEMSRRAPDFWSWRKAVLQFEAETPVVPVGNNRDREWRTQPVEPQPDDEFLPPLDALQAEIAQLEATTPDSLNRAILYDRLGQVYAKRINQGEATDLEQERQLAISAFHTAITHFRSLNRQSALVNSLLHLGHFLYTQSQFSEAVNVFQETLDLARIMSDRSIEAKALNGLGIVYRALSQYHLAIDLHQQALTIKREIGDRKGQAESFSNLGNVHWLLGQFEQASALYQQSLILDRELGDRHTEATSLNNLGSIYRVLDQHHQAIDLYQKALAIKQEFGDRFGEAAVLNNLGLVYRSLSQPHKAVELYQQALKIWREIGNLSGEANSLNNLGLDYSSLGQDHQAIDFHQQALKLKQVIGDRYGEANSLLYIGNALAKIDHRFEAKRAYQQALEIYTKLGLEEKADGCKTAIYNLEQQIALKPIHAPRLEPESPFPRRRFWWKVRRLFQRFWFQWVTRCRKC